MVRSRHHRHGSRDIRVIIGNIQHGVIERFIVVEIYEYTSYWVVFIGASPGYALLSKQVSLKSIKSQALYEFYHLFSLYMLCHPSPILVFFYHSN